MSLADDLTGRISRAKAPEADLIRGCSAEPLPRSFF